MKRVYKKKKTGCLISNPRFHGLFLNYFLFAFELVEFGSVKVFDVHDI